MLNATVRMLHRVGYQSVSCSHPREALERFNADPDSYRAVVTDYQMPEMTGLQLSQKISALRPELPILMLSGLAGAIAPHQLENAGIRRVLAKPVSAGDFLSTLGELTETQEH